MYSRRTFLAGAGSLLLSAGVATTAKATKMASPAIPMQGILYTAEAPGKWKGKEGSHAPVVTLDGKEVTVLTPHDMTPKHYIVRHTIVHVDGRVVAERTMYPDGEPLSIFTVQEPGTYYATSFCNLHDMWVTSFTL